jgi:hypothetical protein
VGIYSHELDVIQHLSSPDLRRDPANHTIRKLVERVSDNAHTFVAILDIIRVPRDGLAFIVQEEWSSTIAHCAPCSLGGFLYAMRQCIEVCIPACSR